MTRGWNRHSASELEAIERRFAQQDRNVKLRKPPRPTNLTEYEWESLRQQLRRALLGR
jgi:hypothetical protein